MTPLQLAENLAAGDAEAQALAVAIVARGLSDDSPGDPFRQPWPVLASLNAATQYLGLAPDTWRHSRALALMPTISDAMLNRRPAP